MRFAIIGYYGHNNLGDELNLYEMMKLIRKQYPHADITIFSGGLPYLYYKVDYPLVLADRLGLKNYRDTLNTYDLIIIGGGGLVFFGANYFNFLMEDLKVPYIFSRVGMDDRMVNPTVVSELKDILNRAYHVSVRTTSDRMLAQKHLGLTCEVVPEAIWNYRAEKTPFVHGGKKILVSINTYASKYTGAVKKALLGLTIPHTIYTVSMQDSANDFYFNIEATPPKRVILPEAVSLHTKASFLASSDLVITSRLHAGLMALSHGVPAIMLKSTPKVAFLLKDLELDMLHNEGHLTSATLESLVHNQQLRNSLLEKSEQMRALADTPLIPKL
mgnify:CR=1 FL=1